MRKILIILLIVLLLVLGYFTIFNGLNIFGMEILSVFAIKDKSEQLDGELQKISTLTSVDRTKAMSDLNDSAKQLVIAKEEYNDKNAKYNATSVDFLQNVKIVKNFDALNYATNTMNNKFKEVKKPLKKSHIFR